MKLIIFISLLLISCSPKKPISHLSLPEVQVVGKLDNNIYIKPNLSREELIINILHAIKLQEKEQLPFDEPRLEFGQQDGMLRIYWQQAYYKGKPTYIFNYGKYYTYNHNGYPLVPQVCADFVVDTIERASGTWFSPSRKDPKRTIGKVEIRETAKKNGYDVRRVAELINFFKTQPDNYQFVFEGSGPEGGKIKEIKSFLKEKKVQLGDIIIISGRVPWDDKIHNHSMIVSGISDTGEITHVSSNPGYAIKRTLRIELGRTPKRRITHIIRLSDEFLISLL